jgi:hypothetical protein
MKEITTVGVDLAKAVFTVMAWTRGRTVLRKTVRRKAWTVAGSHA